MTTQTTTPTVSKPTDAAIVDEFGLPEIEEMEFDISNLNLEFKFAQDGSRRNIVGVEVEGVQFAATPRFNNSMLGVIGQSPSVFNLFEPEEVIERFVAKRPKNIPVRLFGYQAHEGGRKALAIMAKGEKSDFVPLNNDVARKMLERFGVGPEDVKHDCGSVEVALPVRSQSALSVGGDRFDPRLMLNFALDGYGKPNSYLGMLRLVCQNGLVAISKEMKTSFPFKYTDSTPDKLYNVCNTYGNQESFEALEARINLSRKIPASLDEFCRITSIIHRHTDDKTSSMMKKVNAAFGDPLARFGISGYSEIDSRRSSAVDLDVSAYGLINLGTEWATHHAPSVGARNTVLAQLTGMITGGYDMEIMDLELDAAKIENSERALWLN